MNKKHCRIFVVLSSLLLVVCSAISINAQEASGERRPPTAGEGRQRQPAPDSPKSQPPAEAPSRLDRNAALAQPFNSVRVMIRYKKELGYKSEYTFGKPQPTSCSAFSVVLAKPAKPDTPNLLIPVTREETMTADDRYYYCYFLVSHLALDQEVTITASIDDTTPWLGGSQSRLPSGWRRVISDGTRSVALTQSDPKARANFEMIYEPSSEFVQPRRPSGSLIRKP
jgi:hypothetical protein